MIVKLVIIDNENNTEIYKEEYHLKDFTNIEDLADTIAKRIVELEESYPPTKYSVEQIIFYES